MKLREFEERIAKLGWARAWPGLIVLSTFGLVFPFIYVVAPVAELLRPAVPFLLLYVMSMLVCMGLPLAVTALLATAVERRILRRAGLLCPGCGADLTDDDFIITPWGTCPRCEHLVIDDAPLVRRDAVVTERRS